MPRPLLALLLLCAASVRAQGEPASAAADEQQPSEQQLNQLEQKLSQERAAASQLAQQEQGLLGRLAGLERLIDVEGRSLRAARVRLRVGSRHLEQGERRLQAAEDDLAQRARALGPRLTARYRLGREGLIRFLLGARSIGDLLRRKRLFTALLEHDFEALRELRLSADEARAARDELAAVRETLSRTEQSELDRRRGLEEKVQEQRRLLAAVQDERAAHEQSVRELEQAARELSQKLGKLLEEPRPAEQARPAQPAGEPRKPIAQLRGKLLFPVDGGRVEVRFGRRRDPRFGTITLQRGIDVRAPEGARVQAVHDGRVAFSGWLKGYGNLVVVDHGEGFFSLMAHLATLARGEGDELHTGDAVGTVGDTGSLKGAYLYFELRQGQKPLDPERWLSRRVAKKPAG